MNRIKSFFRDERGANMVEYALLASFISIVAIAALLLIKPKVEDAYNDINAALPAVD